MAETDTVFKGKVKQTGIFNFKDIYGFLYDYLMEEKYDVHESLYQEIVKPGDTKELHITWVATQPISDYFKFEIKASWLILGMKKIKVKKGNEEVAMNSGSVEITFTANLVKDHNNAWKNSGFKFLRDMYDKFFIRTIIEDYQIKLYEDVNDAIVQAKSFLTIEGQHTT